jgi:hypothetical protein
MPHEIFIDGERHARGDAIDVGGALRVHDCAGGGIVCITTAPATRDGRPLLGNLAHVEWGASALLRVGGRRVEICWRVGRTRRATEAGARCRVCFGTFAAAEAAVVCVCDVVFHDDCSRTLLTCPGCGAPPAGDFE